MDESDEISEEFNDIPRRPDGSVKQVYETVDLPNYVATERPYREVIKQWYSSMESPNVSDWKRVRRENYFYTHATLSFILTYGEFLLALTTFILLHFYTRQPLAFAMKVSILAMFVLFVLTDVAIILYFAWDSRHTRSKGRYLAVMAWNAMPMLANIVLIVLFFKQRIMQ